MEAINSFICKKSSWCVHKAEELLLNTHSSSTQTVLFSPSRKNRVGTQSSDCVMHGCVLDKAYFEHQQLPRSEVVALLVGTTGSLGEIFLHTCWETAAIGCAWSLTK